MASSPPETFPFPYQPVFDAAVQVLPSIGLKITFVDPYQGLIRANRGMNFTTYGENITINLWAIDAANTGVQIRSDLKFGLVDWGRNAANINRINVALSQFLDATVPQLRSFMPGPPPPPPRVPPPG